jgi:anti-sigma regulatory factor (Ser/Thr protein kinase)
MSSMTAAHIAPPRGQLFQHEALLYDGSDHFLEGTSSFIREALEADEPVLVVVDAGKIAMLREHFAADAGRVHFADMADVGANPARIIPAWRTFVDQHGADGRPVRGIGEPVWAGRRATEIAECQLHEALLNLAIHPDIPLWLRCPYQLDALETSVVDQAMHSHPTVFDTGNLRGSTSYGGLQHAHDIFRRPLPEPPVRAPAVHFDGRNLSAIRTVVRRQAHNAGVAHDRADDLALAVTEIATNSIRHGGGQGSLRMWHDDDAFACEIRDDGHLDNVLVGRRAPALDAQSGRGVWLAHQLTDLVQIRSSESGTTTRVSTWR